MIETRPRSAVRSLALARLVSFTGNGAAAVALAVLILEKTGSSAWVAATLIATHGVQVGAGILTASLGDRYSRRMVMILSEVASAACYLAMALASAPVTLLAIGVVASLVASPFHSASSAAMPNLVEPKDLSWANSMGSAGRNLGMTLGPALGGVVAAAAGAGAVFVVNAVSYLISAAVIATVSGRFSAERPDERSSDEAHRGVAAGLWFVWRDGILRRMMLAEAILVLGIGLVQVARVAFALSLGLGPTGLGLLTGMWGAGLLIGSFTGRFLTERLEPAVFVAGLAGVAVAMLAIGLSPWVGAIVAIHLLVGLADALDLVAAQGVRQRRAPDAVRSRVIAASSSIVVLAQMVGFAAAGFLVDLLQPRGVYVAAGAVVAASAVLAIPILKAQPR